MKKFSEWTINQKLGLLVGGLGFLALFLGTPYRGSTATLDAKELALLVEKEADHVNVEELADWIIQGKSDYRLLDLRSEKEFNEYRIPAAENISIGGLNEYPITRNEKIILYSEGGIHSAQAWMLLKARAYKGVYILRGGLEEWKDKVLFPRPPANATSAQSAAFEKSKSVSKFFGGSPQTGTAEDRRVGLSAMPKLEMPVPGAAPAGGAKKKKKEGC